MTQEELSEELLKNLLQFWKDVQEDESQYSIKIITSTSQKKTKKMPMCYGVSLTCPCNDTSCPAYYPIEPWKDHDPDPTVNHQRHPCL